MDVRLTGHCEKLLSEELESGGFGSPEEVIERALEMLHSESEWLQSHKDSMHDKVERAFAQFDEGAFFSAEESRADMEKRKAVWLSNRKP